ncbi:Glutamate decarboxylase 1 [Strongyloides ratti]|uniref:Glutamate decarboxylase 1 n=1 Tax=Strongyloides ratti TaxID=34506 RepID=A0A090LF70_STRRB|nr:Glutamate decarboxylase 1 [Strongyloides ratti]CEF66150.1 Glutamate decarboxylase 1 [Strongyloides ratti]
MESNNKDNIKNNLDKLFSTDFITTNKDGWNETEIFLKEFVEILLSYIKEENDRSSKVIDFHHPEDMLKLIDLHIPEKGMSLDKLLQSCKDVLKLCVRTGHPRFFNQNFSGLDIICMAGEWATATTNTSMYTYEIAPIFSLMEKEIMRKMIDLVGWGSNEGEGIFTPGGTMANLYGLVCARHNAFPNCKQFGLYSLPKLCCFTSKYSHYSAKAASAMIGIGMENCFEIMADKTGRMIPEALEEKIIECKNNGMYPFFVTATAGTTVYGAFDPIDKIADICEKYNIWLHVDAAWGGGLLLSPEYRWKLKGIERAKSVTWNPHKLMGSLLQCSAFLIKQQGLLLQTNQMSANYLYQQDKPYDVSYDTGDRSFQCGRRNDVLKLWLMWRSKGMEGYRIQINRLMDLAKYFTNKIKKTEGYEMVVDDPQFLNICFWYIPKNLRNIPQQEKMEKLGKIAPKIKGKMMERGTTMVGYQPDTNKPNFFRLIITNPATTKEDLNFLIQEIIDIANDI